jgi:hypothetical protein
MTQRTISEGVSGGFPGQLRGIERVGQVAFSETVVEGEPSRDATKAIGPVDASAKGELPPGGTAEQTQQKRHGAGSDLEEVSTPEDHASKGDQQDAGDSEDDKDKHGGQSADIGDVATSRGSRDSSAPEKDRDVANDQKDDCSDRGGRDAEWDVSDGFKDDGTLDKNEKSDKERLDGDTGKAPNSKDDGDAARGSGVPSALEARLLALERDLAALKAAREREIAALIAARQELAAPDGAATAIPEEGSKTRVRESATVGQRKEAEWTQKESGHINEEKIGAQSHEARETHLESPSAKASGPGEGCAAGASTARESAFGKILHCSETSAPPQGGEVAGRDSEPRRVGAPESLSQGRDAPTVGLSAPGPAEDFATDAVEQEPRNAEDGSRGDATSRSEAAGAATAIRRAESAPGGLEGSGMRRAPGSAGSWDGQNAVAEGGQGREVEMSGEVEAQGAPSVRQPGLTTLLDGLLPPGEDAGGEGAVTREGAKGKEGRGWKWLRGEDGGPDEWRRQIVEASGGVGADDEDEESSAECEVCRSRGDAPCMLLCDGCDRGCMPPASFHAYCRAAKARRGLMLEFSHHGPDLGCLA